MHVGGNEEGLSQWEECAQLVWYFEEHYPVETDVADEWAARLPDRLTHAAMMQLGAARDHSLFVLTNDVTLEGEKIIHPNGGLVRAIPHKAWGPQYVEMAWIPELVSIAHRAGVSIDFSAQNPEEDVPVIDFNDWNTVWDFPAEEPEALPEGHFYGHEVVPGSGIVVATPEMYRARMDAIAAHITKQSGDED
ncbi:MAG: hypothetical protein Q3972_04510 [Corynebacterium sp.]|nr:hypothetical protein [Corynebacterium sp.]